MKLCKCNNQPKNSLLFHITYTMVQQCNACFSILLCTLYEQYLEHPSYVHTLPVISANNIVHTHYHNLMYKRNCYLQITMETETKHLPSVHCQLSAKAFKLSFLGLHIFVMHEVISLDRPPT